MIVNLSTNSQHGLDSRDIRLLVKEIPRMSGIMNSEAQYVDLHGGVHVLNRENTGGQESWVHYYRNPFSGQWRWFSLPEIHPTATGPRGKIVHCAKFDRVIFILPSNTIRELVIAQAGVPGTDYSSMEFSIIWRGLGYAGEPLIDEEALANLGMLSIFTLRETAGGRKIVVLQFDVAELCQRKLDIDIGSEI